MSVQGITDLGCLGQCTVLERLDLSKNNVTKLHKLAGLSCLQALNLSANRISSLDGLQSLENLRSLNLAGNLIGSVSCLRCLCRMEHLKDLRLRDEAHGLSNPACMPSTYVNNVISLFPNLLVLDGHRIRGQGSELFYICQNLDKTLNGFGNGSEINVPLMDMSRLPSSLWRLPEKTLVGQHNKAEEQLQDLLISCSNVSAKAAERLQELQLTSSTDTMEKDHPVAMDTTDNAS
ncbi:leucine-rich repeat-containing protein 61-like isoform X2 [Littorina saxatilis]|uniref:leucine-rich repeat-containing protein 61-like isoform X2 n=1 Tax=Littorina saxatilis TaxID=31220 RepID=UPI0038B4DCF9